MAVEIEQVQAFFSVGQVVLLTATAVFVYSLRPASGAKSLFALSLLLLGVSQVSGLFPLLGVPASTAYWFFVDFGLLHAFAVVATFWAFPRPPAWRSLPAALLAFATVVFAAFAIGLTFFRERFYPTGLGEVFFWLTYVGNSAVLVAAVLRIPDLTAAERASASGVVFALLGGIATLPTFFLGQGIVDSLLLDRSFLAPYPTRFDDVCCELPAVAFVLSVYVAAPLAAWAWWRRERSPFVLLGLGTGLVLFPLAYTGGAFYYLLSVLYAVVALGVFARGRAFGVERAPEGARAMLALVAGAGVFMTSVSVALAAFGDSSLALAGGVVGGIALGVTAAWFALPSDRFPAREEDTTRRLAAYSVALDQELRSGRTPDEARHTLAPLRAALRISEDEHATVARDRRAAWSEELLLGRYRPVRLLGEGGAGVTRLARDERVGRDVVIKSIRGEAPTLDAILREARAIGSIKHPNVLTLHDVVLAGSDAVIVMEHAERGSLRDAIAAGPLPRREWRRVAEGLLQALDAVHAAGVLHRDVKPSNVLLDARGEVKLADFGVARVPGFETTVGGLRDAAVGTFRYAPPEQARGRLVTQRSDLFAAGATLYEALLGAPYLDPRAGESAVEIQWRAANAGAFDRAVEPPALRAWFARALDPEPAARFASAREMLDALEAALGRGAA